jgi:hypothetical protein
MIDYIELPSTPACEKCIGVNEENALALARIEARTYISQLKRAYGMNPEGTTFKIHRSRHDFGDYLDIRFFFDCDNLKHDEYAMIVEDGCDYWDHEAIKELRALGYKLPEDDIMESDNGPTGHGDICYSDADPGL